ncbi:MAG: NAD(P) transhydrogenase subunit alpha [Alphaproteobacteria bacterium]
MDDLASAHAKAQALTDQLAALQAQMGHGGAVDPFIFGLAVFVLACFVGYYVVWRVTPALHTPLMSVTNAISGIIVVGAIIALGPDGFGPSHVFGFIAVFLASINIFGGFIVTQRMLEMFKKKEKKSL